MIKGTIICNKNFASSEYFYLNINKMRTANGFKNVQVCNKKCR